MLPSAIPPPAKKVRCVKAERANSPGDVSLITARLPKP
jgi:hypothetical protein